MGEIVWIHKMHSIHRTFCGGWKTLPHHAEPNPMNQIAAVGFFEDLRGRNPTIGLCRLQLSAPRSVNSALDVDYDLRTSCLPPTSFHLTRHSLQLQFSAPLNAADRAQCLRALLRSTTSAPSLGEVCWFQDNQHIYLPIHGAALQALAPDCPRPPCHANELHAYCIVPSLPKQRGPVSCGFQTSAQLRATFWFLAGSVTGTTLP